MLCEAFIEWDPAASVRALKAAIAEDPDSVVFEPERAGRPIYTGEILEGEEVEFTTANGRGILCRSNGRLVVR